MVPMAPEPGDADGREVQRLSPEAAWGMRALIMVLMFLVRSFGREPTAATPELATPVEGTQPPPGQSDVGRTERAERVAKGKDGATSRAPGATLAPPPPGTRAEDAAATKRRRAMYASALTVAGTAAWMAGRRSGRRG